MKRTVVLMMMLLLLWQSACQKGEQDTGSRTTVVFWHSFVSSTIPALNKLLQRFEDEHPDIHIKAQYIPSGDALIQKLITAIQSNTAPDISWIHADYLEDLVTADAIYQMDAFIHGENGLSEEEMSDIYPSLKQLSSWRGTLYSLPMEATNLGLLYNKEHFRQAKLDPEKPPATWQELKDYALKLTLDKDEDGTFDQLGFFVPIYPASGPLNGWMVWQWFPYLWQAGGHVINLEQTRVLYNEPPGVKALTLWRDIYKALNLKTFTTDYDIAFAAGRVSMAMDGPWNLPRFNKMLKNMDWAIAPLPRGPEMKATVAGGEYLAIFKQTKVPDAAWTFVKWVIQPEIQAFWSIESGYLPIRSKVLEIPGYIAYLDENPNLKTYVLQLEHSKAPRPFDYYNMENTRAMAQAIEKATLGDVDPKVALDEAAVKINKLLKTVEGN